MSRMNVRARLAVSMAVAVLFTTTSAHAYIDPGSGSYIIQILIGVFVGAGFAIATFWRRIVGFFRRGGSSASNEES